MSCEDKQCLQVPIAVRPSNVLPWEVFTGPARDQWTESGRYDYSLAIKLLECFGCDAPEVIEAIDRISIIVRDIKKWSEMKHERENEVDEFKKAAAAELDKL